MQSEEAFSPVPTVAAVDRKPYKMETLREAYQMARSNGGTPGIDGVTFEAIEESGAESFLGQIREELVTNTYRPMRARKKEIPQDGGKEVQ
jgi:RNA-directed DNA polymerase